MVKVITNNNKISNIIGTMNLNDELNWDPLAISNSFNKYFSTIAENLLIKNTNKGINTDPMKYLRQEFKQIRSSITLKKVTNNEVDKIIYSLKVKISHGYDDISTKMLKSSDPYILSPLTYIFNKVLSTGTFPDRLKFSEVKPLVKKKDKEELFNYRPVSLLPSFSKIIEKITYKRLYNYLKDNNLLVDDQYGFREKISTENAVYTLLNYILSELDKRNHSGSLFCDLQKAFDRVNHEILLSKMKFYGILGTVNKLIESYLRNRYKRVLMNSNNSNKAFSE